MKGKLSFLGFFSLISNMRLIWCCHANILHVVMWHLIGPLYLSEWSDQKRKYLFENFCDRDEAVLDSESQHFDVSVQPIFEKWSYGGCYTLTYQWTQQFLLIILLQTKISAPSSSGIAICTIFRWLNPLFCNCCILY